MSTLDPRDFVEHMPEVGDGHSDGDGITPFVFDWTLRTLLPQR